MDNNEEDGGLLGWIGLAIVIGILIAVFKLVIAPIFGSMSASLPTVAAGLASVFIIQLAGSFFYRRKSTADQPSFAILSLIFLIAVVVSGAISFLTMSILWGDSYEYHEYSFRHVYIATGILYLIFSGWCTWFFSGKLENSFKKNKSKRKKIEREKAKIISMINEAIGQ